MTTTTKTTKATKEVKETEVKETKTKRISKITMEESEYLTNGKLIIAIDSGKNNMKVRCGENYYVNHTNKYDKGFTPVMKGENTYNVSYLDREWTIGANASKSILGEGKSDDFHILSALVEITRVLKPYNKKEDNVQDVFLVYGESVDYYFDEINVKEIERKFLGVHELEVDDVLYKFNIKKVKVLPEGIGHIMSEIETFKGLQYVIDIGGCTINFITAMNGLPNKDKSRSFQFGIDNVVSIAKGKLKRQRYMIEEEGIKQALENGTESLAVANVLNETILEQLKKLDDELMAFGMDIHSLMKTQSFSFVGGGSKLFQKQLVTTYHSEVENGIKFLEDAERTNVDGMFVYAKVMFGR